MHYNPNSKDSITIKQTIKFNNGISPLCFYNITPGIKRNKLFIPILFKIVGKLYDKIFNLKKNNKDHIIFLPINYSPQKDQLIYMLVISNKNIYFNHDLEHPSNLYRYTFNNFELTIIYSYFNFPSTKQSISIFPYTKKEEYKNIRGYEWWEIYNLYTDLLSLYSKFYFKKYGIK